MIKAWARSMFRRMLGIKIPLTPAEFLYTQRYNYIGPASSVVCPLPDGTRHTPRSVSPHDSFLMCIARVA